MSGGLGQDPATAAFEQLRSEVALLRRAVEGLAASQGDAKPINYSPTLGKLSKAVAEVDEQVKALGERPALVLTSESIAGLLRRVSSETLAAPVAEFARAQSNLAGVEARLTGAIGVIQDRRRQRDWIIISATVGFWVGIALWIVASGPLARALPASWQAAERMAAAVLGLPRWEAGSRLMSAADPDAWRDLVRAHDFATANAEALRVCEQRADGLKKPVECKVSVAPAETIGALQSRK